MEKNKDKDAGSKRLFIFLYDMINIACLVGSWAYIWMKYYANYISRPFWFKGNALVIVLYACLLFVITHMYGGYKIGYYRKAEVFLSGSLALVITNVISYLQILLLTAALVRIRPILAATGIGIAIVFVWAFFGQWLYQKKYPPHQILMIYDGKAFAQSLIQKISTRDDRYQVCKVIDINNTELAALQEEIKQYESVLFSDIRTPERNQLLKFCYSNNIRVYMTPKITDILVRTSTEIELFDSPILVSENQEFTLEQRIFKRVVDIVSSIIGLILTLPFVVIIAAAIKLEDGGSVFYSQERLTLDGKIFKMYKFRSMVEDADKIDGHKLASEGDPRITKVGRIVRKIRFDELPQLLNILKGEMSLVGPRPEHPEIAAIYERDMPEFKYRLKAKAGLTGYAQVVGKYNTTPYDKIKLDLMYIAGYSMVLDIKIIFMTLKIIFKWDSTEGIAKGKKTAELDKKEKRKK